MDPWTQEDVVAYFDEEGYDSQWFERCKPHQLQILITYEKYDLHSKRFKKGDCHAILSYLKKELRKSEKREKKLIINSKKGLGMVKVKHNVIQSKECVICLEKPDFKNLLTTNCKHHFCKDCYSRWELTSSRLNEFRNITCPYCRKVNPKTVGYIVRGNYDKSKS